MLRGSSSGTGNSSKSVDLFHLDGPRSVRPTFRMSPTWLGHTQYNRREHVMGIGLGIVLLLLGLILALGVVDLPASVDDVVATARSAGS